MTNHSYSTPTHRHMAWAPYSYKKETSTHKNPQNPASTRLLIIRRRSHQLKGTTTSTSENYWRSLKPYNTGGRISPGCRTPSRSSLTTPTLHSGNTPER